MASHPHPTPKHATSLRSYLLVFGGLLFLTATTTWVADQPLGAWHIPVALAIAVCKATLVVLFFMHALESDRLVHLIIIGALLFLLIMLGFTLCDYLSRAADLQLRNPMML